MAEPFLEASIREVLIFVILGLIGAFGSGFYAFLRTIKKCTDKNARDLASIKRAFALYVQLDLIETKKVHRNMDMDEIKALLDSFLHEGDEDKA